MLCFLLRQLLPTSTPFPDTALFRSQLLGAIKEGGREGLETLGDLVGGEDVGDLFRGDFMGGDPDMFMRSGGRDINAVTEMAKAMNNPDRSEEHTSELQSPCNLVCRLLLETKKKKKKN